MLITAPVISDQYIHYQHFLIKVAQTEQKDSEQLNQLTIPGKGSYLH